MDGISFRVLSAAEQVDVYTHTLNVTSPGCRLLPLKSISHNTSSQEEHNLRQGLTVSVTIKCLKILVLRFMEYIKVGTTEERGGGGLLHRTDADGLFASYMECVTAPKVSFLVQISHAPTDV